MVLLWSGGRSGPCLPPHEGGLPDLQERAAGLVPGKTQSGGLAVLGARGGEFWSFFECWTDTLQVSSGDHVNL